MSTETEFRKEANEKGFTLIETVIAMLLLMIASTGVLSLFVYAVNYNSGANNISLATTIAQQQIEELRSVDFNDASLAVTSTSGVALPNVVSNGLTFKVTKTVIGSNNYNGSPTYKTITIQVKPIANGLAGTPVIFEAVRSAPTLGPYVQ